jgi:hypothetical protein
VKGKQLSEIWRSCVLKVEVIYSLKFEIRGLEYEYEKRTKENQVLKYNQDFDDV